MKQTTDCLINRACVPCKGGVPSLNKEKTKTLFLQLKSGWILNDAGHLYREFRLPDFISAMNFANSVAEISETENHHPDLKIGWGFCAVEIWTHKINGLTESDFIS
jgi:4a-hydroxytetrahydrobiopterin dehydratase